MNYSISILKKILRGLALNPLLWKLIGVKIVSLSRFLEKEHRLTPEIRDDLGTIFRTNEISEIRHGPFKGMLYPRVQAFRGAVFAKILGCFERELHPTIENLPDDYKQIINVGSSEGYYTVGFASRYPNSMIYAYDIKYGSHSTERNTLLNMANLNHVDKQLVIGNFCTSETLLDIIEKDTKTLMIIDCEGYEKELLNCEVIQHLAQCSCDLIIETHDCFDFDITTTLRKRFSGTHMIKEISSINDSEKIHEYIYPELTDLSQDTLRVILSENRLEVMKWFVVTPINEVEDNE